MRDYRKSSRRQAWLSAVSEDLARISPFTLQGQVLAVSTSLTLTAWISNLNRQQYFPEQLGQFKTAALTDTLHRIAPYCDITADCVKLSEDNIPLLLTGEEIICEAFDRADQKAMLVNCVLELFPQKYIVSGSGMAGLGSANDIKTRRITSHFYLCGDGTSDVSDGLGLISARVAVCAAHQANMILRIIAGSLDT